MVRSTTFAVVASLSAAFAADASMLKTEVTGQGDAKACGCTDMNMDAFYPCMKKCLLGTYTARTTYTDLNAICVNDKSFYVPYDVRYDDLSLVALTFPHAERTTNCTLTSVEVGTGVVTTAAKCGAFKKADNSTIDNTALVPVLGDSKKTTTLAITEAAIGMDSVNDWIQVTMGECVATKEAGDLATYKLDTIYLQVGGASAATAVFGAGVLMSLLI